MLAWHQMRKGWRGTRHRHTHEQMVYVIKGRVRIKVEKAWHDAAEGDNFIVSSNAEHEAGGSGRFRGAGYSHLREDTCNASSSKMGLQ